MRPWNFLSIAPDSGQMRPRFASTIYRDCCTFLDLELVITCNRKSIEVELGVVSYRDFPSKSHSKFACQLQLATVQLTYIQTLAYLFCRLYTIQSCQWQLKRTFAETVCQLCLVLLVIFRYTAGTYISTIVACLDFTRRSSDYVLSKAGLF